MGGIIVVDFIDMHVRENNKKLLELFKKSMKEDRAKHNIIAPSKFGVVELTRQRVRPETDIKTSEVCPSCNGTGEVRAVKNTILGQIATTAICPKCKGEGRIHEQNCTKCNGATRITCQWVICNGGKRIKC